MQVEIDDWNQQRRSIFSRDPKIIGQWFAEQAAELMSANAAIGYCRIQIWPSTPQEHQAIGRQDLMARFTQDGLLELAQVILDASKRLGDREDACSSTSTATRS